MQMHITKGAYTDVCKLDEAKQASSTRSAVMLPPVEEEGKQREREDGLSNSCSESGKDVNVGGGKKAVAESTSSCNLNQ